LTIGVASTAPVVVEPDATTGVSSHRLRRRADDDVALVESSSHRDLLDCVVSLSLTMLLLEF